MQLLGGHFPLVVHSRAGNVGLRTAVVTAATGAPVGVKHVVTHTGIQNGDLLAAGGIGVPALEGVAGICRHSADLGRCIGIIALSLDLAAAAVGIKTHIAVVGRHRSVINAVHIHVDLAQTATNQSWQGTAAGSTPLAHSKQQVIAGPAFHDRVAQGAGLIQPGAAAVEGDGHQHIKHALGGIDAKLIQEAVHPLAGGVQGFPQKQIGLFLGNTVGHIFIQFAIRHSGAVTDGILSIVPVRLGPETLPLFNNIDTGIADGEIRALSGRSRSKGNAGHQQKHCQHECKYSFFHKSYSSHGRICHNFKRSIQTECQHTRIIPEGFWKSNPKFHFYYILLLIYPQKSCFFIVFLDFFQHSAFICRIPFQNLAYCNVFRTVAFPFLL